MGEVHTTSVINGEKIDVDSKSLTMVEDALTSLIHKHLEKKRKTKRESRKQKSKK